MIALSLIDRIVAYGLAVYGVALMVSMGAAVIAPRWRWPRWAVDHAVPYSRRCRCEEDPPSWL